MGVDSQRIERKPDIYIYSSERRRIAKEGGRREMIYNERMVGAEHGTLNLNSLLIVSHDELETRDRVMYLRDLMFRWNKYTCTSGNEGGGSHR